MAMPHVLAHRWEAGMTDAQRSRKVTWPDIAAGENFPDDEADFDGSSPPLSDCGANHEVRTITMLSGRRYCANCLRLVGGAA